MPVPIVSPQQHRPEAVPQDHSYDARAFGTEGDGDPDLERAPLHEVQQHAVEPGHREHESEAAQQCRGRRRTAAATVRR